MTRPSSSPYTLTALILVMEHAFLVARRGSKHKSDIFLYPSFSVPPPNPFLFTPSLKKKRRKKKPIPIPMACLGGEGMNCPDYKGLLLEERVVRCRVVWGTRLLVSHADDSEAKYSQRYKQSQPQSKHRAPKPQHWLSRTAAFHSPSPNLPLPRHCPRWTSHSWDKGCLCWDPSHFRSNLWGSCPGLPHLEPDQPH